MVQEVNSPCETGGAGVARERRKEEVVGVSMVLTRITSRERLELIIHKPQPALQR